MAVVIYLLYILFLY